MPKNEFDFDDPLELNGVVLCTDEDTTATMAECFIEEFLRLGYNHRQILALFRGSHYTGMNLVLLKHGEEFVRSLIARVFERWNCRIDWKQDALENRKPTAGVQGESESETRNPTGPDTSPDTPRTIEP